MGLIDDAAGIIESRGRVDEGRRLRTLMDAYWQYMLDEYPELATYTGDPGRNHRWTDHSLAAYDRRNREMEVPARVLETIDRAALSEPDRVHYDLFRRAVEEALEGRRFKGEYMPITQMGGVQQNVAQTLMLMPYFQLSHYEDALARLEGLPTLVDQTIALLAKGLETGITPPRITLRDVPQQVRNQLVDDPLASALLQPFLSFPAPIEGADQERLRAAAASAYAGAVAPAYRRLLEYLETTYLARTRATIAMRDLPDGEAWYAFNVRQMTTTRLAAGEIHRIGQAEVRRIRAEMDAVIAQAGFNGNFQQFVGFLRHDPQFFFDTADELLVAYRDICKRVDPELTKMFATLPRLPYGVVPVPSYAEKSQTTAYYEPGSPKAGRPGRFFANTYDLRARPKWEMEALALHEAVPGHHLQIALAQELPDMPDFRRHGFFTAYIEGWGLYAESLGGELGMYKDPYSRFGQLTYEMWRAIRLVVDTGMHALGWTREQAIDFFTENAGKAEHDIVVEVDRYIVWPAQALAYKIGELKIKELRARATAALGERFDLRRFHDEVLGAGALPLDVLEARIDAWIAGQTEPASPIGAARTDPGVTSTASS
jgi:uncharacterized protein (DUF885 family)